VETVELLREDDNELLEPDDPPKAELAECNCPEFCERDHDNE
jgi:hypothetical protein